MTKNQSLGFRFLLFLVGIGILLLAFFLFTEGKELNRIDAFFWLSIGLMYLFFFGPFLFSSFNTENFSKKIPVLSIIWFSRFGIGFYLISSVAILILLTQYILSFSLAVVLQSVLIFLFLIVIYFAYFSRDYVVQVDRGESKVKKHLSQIKSKALHLRLSVDRLPSEYQNTQKELLQTLDDIKYISPVNNGVASEVELKIIQTMNSLSEMLDAVLSNAHTASFEKEAELFKTLVNERKLYRN